MDIHVPISLCVLTGVVMTLICVTGVARRVPANRAAHRLLGAGSLLAGVALFATYLLVGPLASVQAADAEPATPASSTPAAASVAEAPEADAAATAKPQAGSSNSSAATTPASDGVRELTVEPREGVGAVKFNREGRPAWVESAAVRVGAVHTTAVESGPWLSPDESRRALDEKLLAAAREYVAEIVHHRHSDLVAQTFDTAYVKNHLLSSSDIYEEQLEGELSGSTYRTHALLKFDGTFRSEVESRWNAIVTRARLAQIGLVGGIVLVLFASALGLLRADTATRGYYTRTLQLVAAVAILSVVAAGIMLARSFPWL